MKKKFFVISALLVVFLLISYSSTFANTNMINTVEQSVENMASDAGNMITRGIDSTKNTMSDMSNGLKNAENNMIAGMTSNNGNNGTNNYTAMRTNATTATWLGMNATAWTWLIMGIVTIAIVGLVWFYAKQDSTSAHTNE